MRVLVLNAGSSTMKWSVLDAWTRVILAAGREDWRSPETPARAAQVEAIVRRAPTPDAVGHRVVHGGTRFLGSVVMDRDVRAALADLQRLDPLHMGAALAGIDAVTAALPSVTQVASFDTAFHARMPAAAAGYGLPFEWTERWGLRRFGFHGLSVAYALGQARAILGRGPGRTIVCHLGGGCSVTAVADGASVDTTMGFSPLEGVMMATRAGSVDPGLLLYLQEEQGVGLAELRATLETRSGLLGVSGVSADLRRVLAAADEGSPRARLAYDRFVWTLRRAVGAMAGVLGGVDALVFTGGIGENSPRVREDAAAALTFAGLRLDEAANRSGGPTVSAADSAVAALVIEAREDLTILDEVVRLVPPAPSEVTIRPATEDEANEVIAIDDDASALFASVGLPLDFGPDHPFVLAEHARWTAATRAGRTFLAVAGDGPPLGMTVLGWVDGAPFLQQLSVRRSAMRRGIGARLLARAVAWAGQRPLWLTTYAHVPWNRPFYERAGFAAVPPERCPPGVAAVLAEERRHLPEPGQRIAMVRPAGAAAPS